MQQRNQNLIYITNNGLVQIDVNFRDETIWLNQQQIAQLFCVDRSVITKHINSIFKTGELAEKSNVQKMHIANSDKPVKYFSLDLILSVGYRANSKQATQFRIWANLVLKEYLVKGYAVNQKRLLEQKQYFLELQKTIKLFYQSVKIKTLSVIKSEVR